MTPLLNDLGDALFTPEGGGWLTLRRRAPGLGKLTAAELLGLAARSPGNVRYATDAGGAYLIEEVRSQDGLTPATAGELFFGLLDGAEDGEAGPASDEAIEAALDGAGFSWTKRASSWAVVAAGRLPREVLVGAVPGGARVSATLAEWDEITSACSEALERFLVAAQPGLRFARCEMDHKRAQIVGFAGAASLDADLVHALLGVAAGCDLLAREAEALLRPDVAETYLNCRRMP